MQNHTDSQRLSIAHAQLMLEHMRMGLALYDAQQFHFVALNSRFETFLRDYLCPDKRDEQFIGRPITHFLPPPRELAIVLLRIFRHVAETGEPYEEGELPIQTVDKGITYWQWTLDPVRDADGTITHVLQTATEITMHVLARQQAEKVHSSLSLTTQAIEAERKRLAVIETVARGVRASLTTEAIGHEAVEAIASAFDPLGVAIHLADHKHRMMRLIHLFADPEVVYASSLLKEISFDSTILIAKAHKQRNPIIIENVQTATIEGNFSSVLPGVRGYICIPLWSGDYFEGTLTASFTRSICRDGAEASTLEGCALHITAALTQARLLAEIEHERAQLRAILDQLPEGILILDAPDGHIQYTNVAAANISGVPAAQPAHKPTRMPIQSAPLAETIADLQGHPIPLEELASSRALRGEVISGLETTLIRPDGQRIVLLTSAAPLRDEQDTIIGAIIVFQDITAQKSIEQQKNDFLSIASHELRTPIAAIQGFAEILQIRTQQHEDINSPRSQRALTSIVEQSRRLSRLIEETLDLTRIENNRLMLNIAPHDLIQTLKQVIESQSITAKRHTIHFHLEGIVPEETLIGQFDEDRMAQVFNNLISNAIKYSPTGKDIEVGLHYSVEKPDEAIIRVSDSGIGIATHELPYIFERFHRAGNLDRSISGLGIGLYLVNELVTRHSGRVWVESIEGKGSAFYILLPLKRNHLL